MAKAHRSIKIERIYLHFLKHLIQCRTITLWYFLFSMHHADSPWIESIVFVIFWNFLVMVDSMEPPWAAVAPAAMTGEAGAVSLHHSTTTAASHLA